MTNKPHHHQIIHCSIAGHRLQCSATISRVQSATSVLDPDKHSPARLSPQNYLRYVRGLGVLFIVIGVVLVVRHIR